MKYKYVHVSRENGEITVKDEPDPDFSGWAYKVPEDYHLNVSWDALNGRSHIYDLFDEDVSERVSTIILKD
jgi:hypothetical protein